MERARSWVQEQSKGPFSASQTSQGSFPFLGCPSLVRVSAVREVLLGEILPWGCPISHAVENPIEALDEEDQLWDANTQLFYCIINSLVCLTLDIPWCLLWCAGQLLLSCLHTALTLSRQSLLNQRLVLVLRTALAWAKGISCSYAKGGAFRFWLTNSAALSTSPFPSHVFLAKVGF